MKLETTAVLTRTGKEQPYDDMLTGILIGLHLTNPELFTTKNRDQLKLSFNALSTFPQPQKEILGFLIRNWAHYFDVIVNTDAIE